MMKKEKKVRVAKVKKMKKMDMTKLEEERIQVTLKLMNMNLVKHSPEHQSLKAELHRIHAIIKAETSGGMV
jgi:hypothetical protein